MKKQIGMILAAMSFAAALSAQPSSAQSPTGAAAGTAGKTLKIDPAQSEVRVLVHHSSRIGHNHVIVNRHIGGQINFTGDAGTSSFTLVIPVVDFTVDDPAASSEEGADFAAVFTDKDRAETKGHMLGPKLLDSARFAQITVTSTAVAAAGDGFVATLVIEVAGHRSSLSVPFELGHPGGRLTATGSAPIKQSDMGLKPLSFMMGAITIQDEITVKFKLTATAE